MTENKLITKEQSEMIINSMHKQYSKFKKFKFNHWKDGKLLCFMLDSKEYIGECFFEDKGNRSLLSPIYSQYIFFNKLDIKICITRLENKLFKVVPTDIQISNKHKNLVEELKKQGRAKIIEATEMSIKLKLLGGN